MTAKKSTSKKTTKKSSAKKPTSKKTTKKFSAKKKRKEREPNIKAHGKTAAQRRKYKEYLKAKKELIKMHFE